MRSGKNSFWGKWTARRINKLKEWSETAEVRDTMKIHERTLRLWLHDPYFIEAGVAVPLSSSTNRWRWNREKLWLWLIAMGAVKPDSGRQVAENPPRESTHTPAREVTLSKEEAREMLGVPQDHAMRRSPNKEIH